MDNLENAVDSYDELENDIENSATHEEEEQDLDFLNDEDTNEDEEDNDEDDGEDEVAEQPKKKSSGFKKRIDKLTKEKRQLEERLQALEEKSNSSSLNDSQKKEEVKLVKPRFDDFESVDDYNEALESYLEEKLEQKIMSKMSNKDQEKHNREKAEARVTGYMERAAKANEKFSDFNEVVKNLDRAKGTLSQTSVELIQECDFGPEIAYYFGKNMAKFEEIAKMSSAKQAIAINDLNKRIESKVKVGKKTDIPDPIKTVTTPKGQTPKAEYNKNMSFEDFKKMRERQRK